MKVVRETLVFEVDLFLEGHKKIGRDRLVFDSGFESVEGRSKGLMKGALEVVGKHGNFTFTAHTKTALGYEEKTWTGKVESDRVEGFYIWNQRDKAPVKVTFEGRLVPSQKPAKPMVVPLPERSMPAPAVPTPSTAKPPSPR